MNINKMQIGAYIAELRKQKGLTQMELADYVGVTNRSVSRWETGQTLPEYDQILVLARVLSVTTDALLSAGEEPGDPILAVPVASDDPETWKQEEEEKEAEDETPQKTGEVTAKEWFSGMPSSVRRAGIIVLCVILAAILLLAGLLLKNSCASFYLPKENDIRLDDEHFPDETFRNWLITHVAAKSGKVITAKEAESVTTLSLSEMGIQSLEGIRFFPNLEQLDCAGNNLETLDLSENTKLRFLNCAQNKLTELNVQNCPELVQIFCGENHLETIDTSANGKLTVLSCEHNNLSSLDISSNSVLTELLCYTNRIAAIDLTHNPLLNKFDAWQNSFREIDLSCNPKLNYLNLDYNLLTELDVSANPEIEILFCGINNTIGKLDVSNQEQLFFLSCGTNALTELKLNENAPLRYLYCDMNRLPKLDISAFDQLGCLHCDKNPLTQLVLPETMEVDTADADSFTIGDLVYLETFQPKQNADGTWEYDLKDIIDPEYLDRITVLTPDAEKTDVNGVIRFSDPNSGLIYTFDTGFSGYTITVCLLPPREG